MRYDSSYWKKFEGYVEKNLSWYWRAICETKSISGVYLDWKSYLWNNGIKFHLSGIMIKWLWQIWRLGYNIGA
jgi:hypothetical protein